MTDDKPEAAERAVCTAWFHMKATARRYWSSSEFVTPNVIAEKEAAVKEVERAIEARRDAYIVARLRARAARLSPATATHQTIHELADLLERGDL